MDTSRNIALIDFDKKDLYKFLEGKSYNKVVTNYRCVIYVGTPIVEESVTIRRLRYVVDLGY